MWFFCELCLWCSRAFSLCSAAIIAAPQVASGAPEEWTRWSSIPLYLFSSWTIRPANASIQWYRPCGYCIPSLLLRLNNGGSFRGQRRKGLVIAWGYKVPSWYWWKRTATIMTVFAEGRREDLSGCCSTWTLSMKDVYCMCSGGGETSVIVWTKEDIEVLSELCKWWCLQASHLG